MANSNLKNKEIKKKNCQNRNPRNTGFEPPNGDFCFPKVSITQDQSGSENIKCNIPEVNNP